VRHSRSQLEAAVAEAAAHYTIERTLAFSQIQQESSWNEKAVNLKSGAMGLAQFMPATARELGLTNPFDGVASAWAYAKYMHSLLVRFDNDIVKALAGYNWGMGHVAKAVRQHGESWLKFAPRETREYVTKIMLRAQAEYIAAGEPMPAA
jgi:soluble lytic murein transglycosylase-like protein